MNTPTCITTNHCPGKGKCDHYDGCKLNDIRIPDFDALDETVVETVVDDNLVDRLDEILGDEQEEYEQIGEPFLVAKPGHQIPFIRASDVDWVSDDEEKNVATAETFASASPVTTTQIVQYALPDPLETCGVDIGIGALTVEPLSVTLKDGELVLFAAVERYTGEEEDYNGHFRLNLILSYIETGGSVHHHRHMPNTHFLNTVTLSENTERHIYFGVLRYDNEKQMCEILD